MRDIYNMLTRTNFPPSTKVRSIQTSIYAGRNPVVSAATVVPAQGATTKHYYSSCKSFMDFFTSNGSAQNRPRLRNRSQMAQQSQNGSLAAQIGAAPTATLLQTPHLTSVARARRGTVVCTTGHPGLSRPRHPQRGILSGAELHSRRRTPLFKRPVKP